MRKRASLDRLRDISKQRSIRRPLLLPVEPQPCPVSVGGEPTPSSTEWPLGD